MVLSAPKFWNKAAAMPRGKSLIRSQALSKRNGIHRSFSPISSEGYDKLFQSLYDHVVAPVYYDRFNDNIQEHQEQQKPVQNGPSFNNLHREEAQPCSVNRACPNERRAPPVIGGYFPIGSEFDAIPLLQRFFGRNHTIALPVIQEEDEEECPLQFWQWIPGSATTAGKVSSLLSQFEGEICP